MDNNSGNNNANMPYKLRTRPQKRVYVSSSSGQDEYESASSISDPDYCTTTSRTRRRTNGGGTSKQDMEARTTTCLRINDNTESKQSRGRPRKRSANNANPKGMRNDPSRSNQEHGPSDRYTKGLERTILSWLIEYGRVIENERIQYVATREGYGKQVMKEGKIRKEGVWCGCCNVVMTVWDFEIHAGGGILKRPYENIFVARSNCSLLQYQIDAWNSKVETERRRFNQIFPRNGAIDQSDDACLICADGGDLMCCEKCPSTFHLSCIGMKSIPLGDWLCPYCVCKYCGHGNGDLQTCLQCEKKYHWQCFLRRQELDLNASACESFCGSSCREVYEKLQRLVGVKHELHEGFCWTLLRRMEPGDLQYDDEHTRAECNSKISVAWEVLNESFRTNTDRHTQINIVQSVVYGRGSNLTRINFRGFYTAILEKRDEIISVASIRVHGTQLAEMPFMATRHAYRKRGLSKNLFVALESTFSSLGIEHLVIPSVQQLVEMWKWKYGFSPLSAALNRKIMNFNSLMFPSTVRLQKIIIGTSNDSTVAMEIDENGQNCSKLAFLDLNKEPDPEPRADEIIRPVR